MPTPSNLSTQDVLFNGAYYPSLPATAPGGLIGTIRAGSNVWRDPGGKIRVANGLLEMSATNVGARIFAADIQRAAIDGGLVGSRLPFAGLLRYENAVLLYLSENTSAQVYLDEVAVSGLTTSSTAGRLRVAVPGGLGGYDVYDSGFEKPTTGNVLTTAGAKGMESKVGVARARWRTSTNAIGPVSDITYLDLTGLAIPLAPKVDAFLDPSDEAVGQDGWVMFGTRWDDQSGELRVVRYVREAIRGTFTVEPDGQTLTGTDTFWTQDLRPGDTIQIPALSTSDNIVTVVSDTEATAVGLLTPGSGYTMTITEAVLDYYDGELGDLAQFDIIRPPSGAGVVQYAGRVLVWGCFGESGSPTGPVIFPMLDDNPEHCFIRGIRTDSGGDLVNVLGADGPLYLMTTMGLEIVTLTGDPNAPYNVRQIASPGFKATSNGILYGDYFYGFSNRPLRTRAGANIDREFAAPVWIDMEGWDAQRVVLAGDPVNEAVLYIYDDGESTIVIPFMTQQEQWGPPIHFSGRFLDAAIVDGNLYVTVLDGSDITVNRWEGGSGIGGTRFISSQYYDPASLRQNRLKILDIVGKVGSLSVYTVISGSPVPDVEDLGAATATFTLSDADIKEPEIRTNIRGDAFAFRVDFASDDGHLDKVVASGLARSETR